MKHLLRRVSVLLIGCALPWYAGADQFDSVRELIRQRMLASGTPAVSLAVWRDGKILWEEGFGWADRENRIAASEHTAFCLASLSKTMTAVGAMTLVQAGKMDLDRTINDYLGPDKLRAALGDVKDATVRRVANHTSGLPGSDQFFYGEQAALLPSMDQTIRRYAFLEAPPGERFEYSNLGYGILGHALARVSGKSYADFMREAVFQPLGMTRSSVDVTPALEPYQAVRYDYTGKRIPYYYSAEPASASVYASAHDLARFGMFFLGNELPDQQPILTRQSIARMTRDAVEESPHASYGIGIEIVERGGYRMLEHGGSTSGVRSILTLVPAKNLGVVVLANMDTQIQDEIRTQVLKTLLPDWKAPEAAAEAGKSTFRPTAQLTGTWRGTVQTYEGTLPIELKIHPSGDVKVRIGKEEQPNRSNAQLETLLNHVTFEDGVLKGRALSQIVTGDTRRHPHTVSISFKLRGQVMNGSATAVSLYDGFWIYGLPHWTELKRVSGGDLPSP